MKSPWPRPWRAGGACNGICVQKEAGKGLFFRGIPEETLSSGRGRGCGNSGRVCIRNPGAHVPAALPPELCGRSPQACPQARRAPRLSLPGICMWARPSRQNRHLPIGQERIRAVPKLRAGRYRRHRFAPGCIFKKEAALNLRIHERRCIAKNISGGKYGRAKSIFPVWPLGEKSRPFDPH